MYSVAGSSRGAPSSFVKSAALVGEIDKNLKYKVIHAFLGEREKIHFYGYLLQLMFYVKFNRDNFKSRTEHVL